MMHSLLKTTTALLTVLAFAACSSESSAPTPPSAPGTVNPANWPKVESPVGLDAAMEARITEIISQMTLRQKIGQIVQADIGSITPEELKTYPLGSILNGGNSAPNGDNRSPASAWVELADEFWEASKAADLEGGPFIPLLWGTDAVHGHNNVPGATVFPHNIGLGATRNPSLLGQIGAVTAQEIRVGGQEWTFAPTIAVVRDDRWGRTYEVFKALPVQKTGYKARKLSPQPSTFWATAAQRVAATKAIILIAKPFCATFTARVTLSPLKPVHSLS